MDILSALGLGPQMAGAPGMQLPAPGTQAYDAAGLGDVSQAPTVTPGTPAVTPTTTVQTPGTTPTQGSSALDQAKVLAKLQARPTTGVDRAAAGMGAKMGAAPHNKAAAVLDGLMSGFSGAASAGKTTGTDDIQKRMGMLKTLFDMDRSLATDKSNEAYRAATIASTNKRTDAYVAATSGKDTSKTSTKKGPTPLQLDNMVGQGLKRNVGAQLKALTDDDALSADDPNKLPAADRAKLQKQVDDERARLQGLAAKSATGSSSSADSSDDSSDDDSDETPTSVAPANPAGKISSTPIVTPKDTATPITAPAPAAQQAPKITPEVAIGQAKAAIAQGYDPDAVKSLLKQTYGIEPSVLDQQ